MFDKLLKYWRRAASDLEFQMIVPYVLTLKSGRKLEALFLVPKFGSKSGMLIFGSYDHVRPYVKEIVESGYGFSVLSVPMENQEYRKENYINVLVDWGWEGGEESRPSWL